MSNQRRRDCIYWIARVQNNQKKTTSGAKAMMLPYALRHSSQDEDRVAEQWELQLADFLAVLASYSTSRMKEL